MKKRGKKGRLGLYSNKVGSFLTWETLGLGAFQWPWRLVPTWGMTQNSLNANRVHFLGILMLETNFWCRLNLLENMLNDGFLCTIVLVCEKLEKKKKIQSACVVFCMNNMLFLRKDGDMSMHAVILYHADLM